MTILFDVVMAAMTLRPVIVFDGGVERVGGVGGELEDGLLQACQGRLQTLLLSRCLFTCLCICVHMYVYMRMCVCL